MLVIFLLKAKRNRVRIVIACCALLTKGKIKTCLGVFFQRGVFKIVCQILDCDVLEYYFALHVVYYYQLESIGLAVVDCTIREDSNLLSRKEVFFFFFVFVLLGEARKGPEHPEDY